jgi:hypothetical protein
VQELLFIIVIDGKAMHFNFLIEKDRSGFIFLKRILQRNGFSIFADTFAPGKWMKHMVYVKVF